MKAVLLSFGLFASCSVGDNHGLFFNENPEVFDEDPEGLWAGTLTLGGAAVLVEGFVQGGDLLVFGPIGNVFLRGPIAVSGNSLTGTATLYEPDNAGIPSATATASLTGTVSERSNITSSFTASDGVQGSLVLSYSTNFEKDSSLGLITGIWSRTLGGATRTITIHDNGALDGSDTAGCVYNGTVNIIDPNFNTYRMEVTVSSCDVRDGSYTGYAEVGDTAIPNDTLVFAFANTAHADTGSLFRQ